MIYEKSCGAVIFTTINNQIHYLLIKSIPGVYGFPKGHVENKETEEETALREIQEEVGIKATLISGFKTEDEYVLPRKKNVKKRVVYFLGYYQNQDIHYQKEEVSDAILVDYESAIQLLQFESSKRIITEANRFLSGEAI